MKILMVLTSHDQWETQAAKLASGLRNLRRRTLCLETQVPS